MLGRKTALLTVVALGATLAAAAPARAAGRERAQSPHNADSVKTVTATCPDGEEVWGAGGRVVAGLGQVRLDSIVPTRTSVTVRGEAFPDHDEPWSVVATAVCAPATDDLAQTTTIETGTPTAECPPGTDLSGTGFDLASGSVLKALIPDPSAGTVTVRTPMIIIGGAPTTAYAICVPRQSPTYTRLFQENSAMDTSAPKLVTVGGVTDVEYPQLTGVGGEIVEHDDGSGPQLARTDIFIDTLMPSDDLTRATVQAVDRSPVVTRAARSVADDEAWSLIGYGLNAYYY